MPKAVTQITSGPASRIAETASSQARGLKHGQTELERPLFHRRVAVSPTPAGRPIRLRHHKRHVVLFGKHVERRHGERRSAHEDGPHACPLGRATDCWLRCMP